MNKKVVENKLRQAVLESLKIGKTVKLGSFIEIIPPKPRGEESK